VLVFTLALSILTGILFGAAPALQATKPDLAGAMKEGGRGASADVGRRRLRGTLVVIEVALAFMLLVGSGLLIRSFFGMMNAGFGFDQSNVLTMNLPIRDRKFPDTAQLLGYVREIMARVDAVPGVRESAVSDALPLQGFSNGMPFLIASGTVIDRANRRSAGLKMVSASYFHTLGIKLVKGRGFTDRDVRGTPPVMVINQTFANRFFSGADPIGQRVLVQEIVPGAPQLGPEIPWEVVGVIADEKTFFAGTQSPAMYLPIEQSPSMFINLSVRTSLEPLRVQKAIAESIHDLDRNQPLSDVLTLEQIKSQSAATDRLRMRLLAVFAAFALLLSAIGIYGVISYTVVQRTHEIGIRAALGADAAALLRLVLTDGIRLTVIGLAAGLALSLALGRMLATFLFGVTPRDPATIGAAAAALAIVALAACDVPARRAARLDPLVALREE
jgi:putative ABC transport system permease protein